MRVIREQANKAAFVPKKIVLSVTALIVIVSFFFLCATSVRRDTSSKWHCLDIDYFGFWFRWHWPVVQNTFGRSAVRAWHSNECQSVSWKLMLRFDNHCDRANRRIWWFHWHWPLLLCCCSHNESHRWSCSSRRIELCYCEMPSETKDQNNQCLNDAFSTRSSLLSNVAAGEK